MSRPLGANYWRLWIASVISNFGDGVATVAYPWLASAVTRNPVHIALVTVATRLPWLLFSLPAGVITDRADRKRLVVVMDGMRFVATFGVALVVLSSRETCPHRTRSRQARPFPLQTPVCSWSRSMSPHCSWARPRCSGTTRRKP